MPNLRGPDERRRRLYANVVSSVLLYGAPVCGNALATSKLLNVFTSLERSVAQKVISAYRTVSSCVASLLARIPPIRLVALMRVRIYERTQAHRENGSYSREIKNTI